jgi:AcrR family transcriptional regulator
VPATTDQRRADRRDELLRAAIEVIRTEGPDASMDRIAAGAGITKPIVYRHFGDREGLVKAVGLEFVSTLVLDIAEVLKTDRPPRELIRRTIDTYVRHVEADAALYRFLIQEAPQGGIEFLAALVAEEVAKVLHDLLARQAIEVADGQVEVWAYGLVGMAHFAGDWWAYRQTMTRDQLVEHLSTLAWSGITGLGIVDPDPDPDRSQP